MGKIDRRLLRVELARAGWTQRMLAEHLNTPPTTLTGWLSGVHPPPSDLVERVATALGVSRSSLTDSGDA